KRKMKFKLFKQIILNKVALWLSYLKLIPILKKLGKDSIVIDCGANVGNITKKFADTGAIVHSFEPDSLAFSILKKKFESTSNVILHNQGVWDKETDLELYTSKKQESDELAF